LFLLAATLGVHQAAAQEVVAPAVSSRVRAADRKAAVLLAAGRERSATFRTLIETLAGSDLVVYVETRQLTLPGQLQLVSATPGGRYVRVSVKVMGLENDLLEWLAHELWHAVELAGAPQVRDQASLLRFFEEVGGGSRAGGSVEMETRKAQEIQSRILTELRRGTSSRAPVKH